MFGKFLLSYSLELKQRKEGKERRNAELATHPSFPSFLRSSQNSCVSHYCFSGLYLPRLPCTFLPSSIVLIKLASKLADLSPPSVRPSFNQLDSLKARLQTARGNAPSITALAAEVMREEGIRGYWRGCMIPLLTISIVREFELEAHLLSLPASVPSPLRPPADSLDDFT